MARQTFWPPHEWIVIDDGATPTKCTMGQKYFYKPEFQGKSSLVNKVRFALSKDMTKDLVVTGDVLVFIEDDDWYAPHYLDLLLKRLNESEDADMVGEGNSIYYNVESRWWAPHFNMQHASLCQTAIRRELFPLLMVHCSQDDSPFIDSRIWAWGGKVQKAVYQPEEGRPSCVGIKSMPGRKGYGLGHNCNRVGHYAKRPVNEDPDMIALKRLVGDDYRVYEGFYSPSVASVRQAETKSEEPVDFHVFRTETGRARGPQWMKWLGQLKTNRPIMGMEIGTFQGESAEWMLENIFTHPDSKYYCVDPWLPEGSEDHKYAKVDCTKNEEVAKQRLARFGDRCVLAKGFSQEVLKALPFEFDFIYVDGDHRTQGVLRDAVLAFDLLKIGGLIVFDDYQWTVMPDKLDQPKTGIDAFLHCYGKHLQVVQPIGWQLAAMKISH